MREILTSDADSWPGSWAHTQTWSASLPGGLTQTVNLLSAPSLTRAFSFLSHRLQMEQSNLVNMTSDQLQLLVRVWVEI